MRPVARRWKALLGGVLALASAGTARGQFANPATGSGVTIRPAGGREGLTTTTLSERGDAELGGAGTVESSLVRDTQVAQESFFRTFQTGLIRAPKLGYGQGQLTISAPLGETTGLSLFTFAGKPEDAEIKLGNLYLDIFSLSGSVLWSDNINLTEVGRKSDAISAVRLRAALIFQIN